jgi:hypothetical protein
MLLENPTSEHPEYHAGPAFGCWTMLALIRYRDVRELDRWMNRVPLARI